MDFARPGNSERAFLFLPMTSTAALIDSFVRDSLGPAATEGQKHLMRHALFEIMRAAIAEDRVMQQHARMAENMRQVERAVSRSSR